MDADKIRLLFGHLPPGADPDDPDQQASLAARGMGLADLGDLDAAELEEHPAVAAGLMACALLTRQIANEEPPEVWEAAKRLRALGRSREIVMGELVLTIMSAIARAAERGGSLDKEWYLEALGRLPLPSPLEVADALGDAVRAGQGISIDEAERLAAAKLGFPPDEQPYRTILDELRDRITDPDEPLALLGDDRLVHPLSLYDGVVLTHRVTEAELAAGVVDLPADHPGISRWPEPFAGPAGEELELELGVAGPQAVTLRGPEGWLADLAPGDLVALRARPAAGDAGAAGEEAAERAARTVVSPERLAAEPPPEGAEVELALRAYEQETGAGDLPATCEDLLLWMLLDEPGCLAEPRLPLSEVFAAAGLEVRGGLVARGEKPWRTMELVRTAARVVQRVEDEQGSEAVLDVVQAFLDGATGDALRPLVRPLRDARLLEAAADELLRPADREHEQERARKVLDFARSMLAAARRGRDAAAARWLVALAHERAGDVLAAEEELRRAVAEAPDWAPAVDRLAWYRSDRGQLAEALRLWRGLDDSSYGAVDIDELEAVEELAAGPRVSLGRNDPCWCGSGRKYKVCHLGRTGELSLAQRASWLRRKAVGYLLRRGGAASDTIVELMSAFMEAAGAEDDHQALRARALGTAWDLALEEGGWFRRFLEDRGPLLPEDELALATRWTGVSRSVYEVAALRPGELVLRDLRSGQEVVIPPVPSMRDLGPGAVLGARVVPAGDERSMLAGLAFPVPVGREKSLLDVIDLGDPELLAAHLGALLRAPRLATREGEPLVGCEAVLEVPDALAARSVLDARYERGEDGQVWRETHELAPGDTVLRAKVTLQGTRLTVETMSEQRLDRVLDALHGELEGLRLVSVDRTPADELLRAHHDAPGESAEPAELGPKVIEEVQDRLERRWCEEEVPALGGVTPRDAAADPTRRPVLERLLREFEGHEAAMPPGGITTRTARIRELLGVPG